MSLRKLRVNLLRLAFLPVIFVGLCFENILMLVLVLLIPAHVLVVRLEETHLEEVFGQQYLAYKRVSVARMERSSAQANCANRYSKVKKKGLDRPGVFWVGFLRWMRRCLADLLDRVGYHGTTHFRLEFRLSTV